MLLLHSESVMNNSSQDTDLWAYHSRWLRCLKEIWLPRTRVEVRYCLCQLSLCGAWAPDHRRKLSWIWNLYDKHMVAMEHSLQSLKHSHIDGQVSQMLASRGNNRLIDKPLVLFWRAIDPKKTWNPIADLCWHLLRGSQPCAFLLLLVRHHKHKSNYILITIWNKSFIYSDLDDKCVSISYKYQSSAFFSELSA